ncbi:MAG: NAD(P)/FAD-dependent oxidoreductase [Proteobacteria bacterium]|nr:NAD(P)/FAD-dependent oxidoreductase [Pseudomonadota bacterium]
MKRVVIVGGGFAGLNAAKTLGGEADIHVTLIDRNNHHLFQPLLYQVATAGLSPAEIAVPLRSILSAFRNIEVLQGEVIQVDFKNQTVMTDFGPVEYDYLILCCGSKHAYFGNESWEAFAPGLKTIEQAIEIRRRILYAFEQAERIHDPNGQLKYLTFVIVGGGPTGVELAGAIGEMSRFTLKKDFRNINPALTRIILIEAGLRILPAFSKSLSDRATRDLESLGVQVWTSRKVTRIDENGIDIGEERITAGTVLWAAGIKSEGLSKTLGIELDAMGRVIAQPDLSINRYPNVFVAGDQANFSHQEGKPLPGISPVALQQGICIAKNILREINGLHRENFHYENKGQMATIGKKKAIAEIGKIRLSGLLAWCIWLVVHIYYIIGFNNRLFILLKWATSYITNKKGARLITNFKWRFYE